MIGVKWLRFMSPHRRVAQPYRWCLQMPGTSVGHVAVSRRAYLYLALVPMCLVGWTVLIVFLRPHVSESSLYKLLDGFPYLAAVGVVILVAVPIRFRRSSNLMKLI
jgi:hypothetical protein